MVDATAPRLKQHSRRRKFKPHVMIPDELEKKDLRLADGSWQLGGLNAGRWVRLRGERSPS